MKNRVGVQDEEQWVLGGGRIRRQWCNLVRKPCVGNSRDLVLS